MNALQIANLIYLLIQEGKLLPDAAICLQATNNKDPYWISQNKSFIIINA